MAWTAIAATIVPSHKRYDFTGFLATGLKTRVTKIVVLLTVEIFMKQSNAETHVEVTKDQLPLHCPTPDSPLWNSHPRVFIPLEETGEANCPYCGTVYKLVSKLASAKT